MQLNRTIGYTESWKHTFYIILILCTIFCSILIFLQPFDTYQNNIPHKNLKLLGYALPVSLAIIVIHAIENSWYAKIKKWKLANEMVIIAAGFLLISLFSFFYLNTFVNDTAVPIENFFNWMVSFSLPFAPFLLGLWVYLRFQFSQIDLKKSNSKSNELIEIRGENTGEVYHISFSSFLYANAQSNYVDIYLYQNESNEKIVIRSSFSKFIEQVPDATQVHRSYAINLDFVQKLEGNTRKGFVQLKNCSDTIPVSPKHFKALKKQLQTRP